MDFYVDLLNGFISSMCFSTRFPKTREGVLTRRIVAESKPDFYEFDVYC